MTEARERFEASTDFTIGLEEEFAILDPETLELEHRFEDIHAACLRDELLAEAAVGRADRHPRSRSAPGEARDLRRGAERQRERRERLFAIADEHGARAGGDRHPSVGRLPRPADHRHAALPPAARGTALGRAAQQHLEPARAHRGRAAPTGRSPSATGCASCCPAARRSPPTRRSSTAATRGLHTVRTEIFTRTFPRCGVPEPFGDWDAYADFVDAPGGHGLDRRGDAALVERAPAPLLRHGRGADLRRPDARRRVARRSPP